MTKLTTSRRD